MANKIGLEIITPSKRFYKDDVVLAIVRTVEGDEGYMAGHMWGTKLLQVSEMWIQETEEPEYRVCAIAGGFVVCKDSVTIYTDAAEWAENIDMERVLSEKAKAEEAKKASQAPVDSASEDVQVAKSQTTKKTNDAPKSKTPVKKTNK